MIFDCMLAKTYYRVRRTAYTEVIPYMDIHTQCCVADNLRTNVIDDLFELIYNTTSESASKLFDEK